MGKMPDSCTPINDVLLKAKMGSDLTTSDAFSLVAADLGDTQDMCTVAGWMRDQVKGNIVTFSPKVFIPLTHLCRDFCGYCTFRKNPQQAGDDLFMTAEQILQAVSYTHLKLPTTPNV